MSKSTDTVKPMNQSVLHDIARNAQLVWRLMLDPRVSLLPKLIVPAIILYVISPLDVVPDFLIVTGQLDDIALIYFGIKLFLNLCPADVVEEHRRALGDPSAAAAPKSDYVDGTFRVVDGDK